MRALLNRVLDVLSAAFCGAFGLGRAGEWSARVAQRMAAATYKADDEHGCRFVAPSPIALWRAKTLLSKEPETIRWIRSFSASDVFYDIGANVGTYSIFAAHHCRRVYAFEPEAQNFFLLNRNVVANGLQDRIIAYPLAIAGSCKMDTLRVSSLAAGAAFHSFGTDLDFKGEQVAAVLRQGSLSVSLDELVQGHELDFPTRIKIDVDGLESEVLKGGRAVLSDARLRGLLVEVTEDDKEAHGVIGTLQAYGLVIVSRGEAIRTADARFTMRNYILERAAH